METNFAAMTPQEQSPSNDQHERDRLKRQMRIELEISSFTQDGIAEDLGVSPSTISHWKREAPGESCMPAHWLVKWTRVVGPGLLRWISRQAGYDLVVRDSHHGALMPSVERLLGMFSADAGAALGQRLEGKALDLDQWKHIQHGVNAIVDVLELDKKRVKA